jgi:hypothetical protein
VPPGAYARVALPGTQPGAVRENGRPLSGTGGILNVATDEQQTIVTVGSGRYDFTTPWNQTQ